MSCSPKYQGTKPTRRGLLSGIAALPLAACSSSETSENPYSLSYSTLGDAIAIALGVKEAPGVSLEQAAAIPYSTLGYRIGDSAEGLLILGSQNGKTFLWTASTRVVLVTEGGRITKSAGLPWNLSASSFQDEDPAADFSRFSSTGKLSRTLDFADLSRFSVPVTSTFARAGSETIQILGHPIATRIIIENCDCDEFNWQFQNKYWIDQENGFCWKSQQLIHPKLDSLQIEIFRPPG